MIIKRLYTNREVVDGLHLVWNVFIRENAKFCTEYGIREFSAFIKMENFMPLVVSGRMIMFGAMEGDELCGIGAVQSNGHIALLFVRPDRRRQGIGRALLGEMCRCCMGQMPGVRVTVNASPDSDGFYHRFGFLYTGPAREENGMKIVPMYLQDPMAVNGYGKKKKTGLIAGIVGVCVVFLLFMGLLFGKIVSNIALRNDSSYDDGQVFEVSPFEEGESGSDSGADDRSISEEPQGIDAINGYEEENLPYTIKEETYSYFSTGKTGEYPMQFDVKYPQITGMDGENVEKINEILKECAMSTTETLYLNPSNDLKERMLEEQNPFLGSQVTYKVTYAGSDFISVVFNDVYYAGNTDSGFCDLRTRNLRISDAKQYEVSEIVDLSDAFMQDWIQRMKGEAPSAAVLGKVRLNDFRQTLNGEILENRYFDAFFVDADGMEIGITYHYPGDGQNTAAERGWITAPYTMEEIIEYKTDSEFWNLVKSHN